MPFVARSKESGERIDITTLDNPKARLKVGDCICQLCGAPMTVRNEHLRLGYKVSAHFAHLHECNSEYDAHPESPEHRYAKVYMRDQLAEFYGQWVMPEIDLEVPVRMEWRARGRIADIMVTHKMGWREVHEIQLAAITPQELQERTDDYRDSGIDVTWWLGGRANTPANRDWCISVFGESYVLFIERTNPSFDNGEHRDYVGAASNQGAF